LKAKLTPILAAILWGRFVYAQATGITGHIADPSGGVVAKVIVSVTGEDGTKMTTQFPALRAGTYQLRFDVSGFAPAERTVSLLVGQTPTVDITLRLASTRSTVEVQESTGAIDTVIQNISRWT
jgi:hypothetical protein